LGAIVLAAFSVRQSKDWMVIRSRTPASRAVSTMARTKVSGSGVSERE
jgi:hypothetical protein